jgi:uncharacterized phage-associated protein
MTSGEKILLYFLAKKALTRTEIMKYLYLYEYVYRKHTGEPGTEFEFVRWEYGPFENTIYGTLEYMEFQGEVSSLTYRNIYGSEAHSYSANRQDLVLNEIEQDVADYVIHELSQKSFKGMLAWVYSTPPMLKVLELEENDGRRYLGEVLPMNETKGVFQRTRAGREGALQRLKAKQRIRGTDEEYYKVLTKEYQWHEEMRGRAKGVGQRLDS